MQTDRDHVASQETPDSTSHPWLFTWIKRIFAILAFGVVVYLFWPLLTEIRNVAALFRQARWEWIGLAILIQGISYCSLTALNDLLLRPFQGQISFWRLMALLPAMAFIEVAVPSGGVSGVVLRARLLGRSGFSVEASSFTLLMETFYIAAAMITASLSGVWYLIQSGGFNQGKLIAVASLTILLLVAGIFIYRGFRNKQIGYSRAIWLVARWNQIMSVLHRPLLQKEELEARLDSFYTGIDELKRIPLGYLLAAAIGRVTLDILSLGICFIAFHYVISPGILLTGYGLMLLLSGLAALPGGLGLADVSLAIIFSRLGAPGAVAVAAALTYRVIAFWLLRFIGFVTWQVLELKT